MSTDPRHADDAPDVAGWALAWQHRHPLALRLTAEQIDSVGLILLPHAGPDDGGEGKAAAGRKGKGKADVEPADAAPAPRLPWWKRLRRGAATGQPLYSENLIPEIGRRKLQAFALRHGFSERPEGGKWPEREAELDPKRVALAAASGQTGRVDRLLFTAALVHGSRRQRLVFGAGPNPAVLGHRWLDRRRVALASTLGVVLIAAAGIGGWALWDTMGTRRDALTAAAAASGASAAGSRGASAAGGHGPAGATAQATPGASAAAGLTARPHIGAHLASIVPNLRPQLAEAARRSRGDPAASAGSAASGASLSSAAPAASAGSAAGTRVATAASGPMAAGASASSASAAAAGPSAPAASAPSPPEHHFALVSPPMRRKADAEAALKRLQTETERIRHPVATQTSLLSSAEGYRISWWPFKQRRQADNAQAAMADRKVRLEVVEF